MLEGQSSGAQLGTLQAKDPDEGENGTVFYSLSGTVPAEQNTSVLISCSNVTVLHVDFNPLPTNA